MTKRTAPPPPQLQPPGSFLFINFFVLLSTLVCCLFCFINFAPIFFIEISFVLLTELNLDLFCFINFSPRSAFLFINFLFYPPPQAVCSVEDGDYAAAAEMYLSAGKSREAIDILTKYSLNIQVRGLPYKEGCPDAVFLCMATYKFSFLMWFVNCRKTTWRRLRLRLTISLRWGGGGAFIAYENA